MQKSTRHHLQSVKRLQFKIHPPEMSYNKQELAFVFFGRGGGDLNINLNNYTNSPKNVTIKLQHQPNHRKPELTYRSDFPCGVGVLTSKAEV